MDSERGCAGETPKRQLEPCLVSIEHPRIKERAMKRLTRIGTATGIVLVTALFLAFSAPAASLAIDRSEYEYEEHEGLHQEEWYDPSDWFDYDWRGGVDYESDWYDYTYGQYDIYDDYAYDGEYYGDDIRGYYDDDFYEDNDFDDEFGFDEDYEYDYYSDEWYKDDDLF
jgi:hypothetical protein